MSSWATRGLTAEDWEAGPSTESKSRAVAFGTGACEFNGGREREEEGGLKKNKVEEDEAAREKERGKLLEREKAGQPPDKIVPLRNERVGAGIETEGGRPFPADADDVSGN